MNRTKVSTVFCFVIALISFIAVGSAYADAANIDSCRQIGVAGTYTLNESIVSTAGAGESCFKVNAAHVTIDCAGYSITGSNITSSMGIYSNKFNTTILNCDISNFATGIKFDGADNGRIENTDVSTSKWWGHGGYAIHLVGGANYNTITGSSATATGDGHGIYIFSNSNFNTITDTNAASNLGNGIKIILADSNHLSDLTASSIESEGIYISASSGNTLENLDTTSVESADFGISISAVDDCDNTLTDVLGTDGKPILYYSGSPATVSGEDASMMILCNADGSEISNSQATRSGIQIYYTDNAEIEDVNAISTAGAGHDMMPHLYPGLQLVSSNGNTLTDVTASSQKGSGVLLKNSDNNIFTNVEGETVFSAGITLDDSNNNMISGCTGYASGITNPIPSGFGLMMEGSSENTITDCDFTSDEADGVLISMESNGNTLADSNIVGKSGGSPISFAALTLMYGVHDSVFANNTIDGLNGDNAVALIAPWNDVEKYVTGNVFYNNTISNADTLLYVEEDSTENIFYWNSFEDGTLYIDDQDGGNLYDTTINGQAEGNIYENVLDGTVEIMGDNPSGYGNSLNVGTEGTGYPYNAANSLGKVSAYVVDNAPLTPFTTSVCGDGNVEGTEECESGDCCDLETCMFKSSAEVCRESAGICDVAESCTGTSTECPDDAFLPETTQCRAPAADCDAAEFCSGSSVECVADEYLAAGTECRAAANTCDVAETCTGVDMFCPTNTFQIAGTPCSDGAYCNGNELCDGSGACSAGTNVDCSANDVAGIETCTNVPDGNIYTWDYLPAFTSECNEDADECTTSSEVMTHTCDTDCGADCDLNSQCADTSCGDDGCVGIDYYDYTDVANTCDGCLCSHNQCGETAITYSADECAVCGDGFCSGDETVESCAADCTEETCTLSPSPDLNGDGMIDMSELFAYIERWQLGEVTMDQLFQAIEYWESGVGC